ncbi:NUDIX hydrolase [Actinomadura hibisca]|uniref:NUDIX hydrolase n=1 Tax=Actinomadura hibisca TaxID=68565 RepID=UPI001FDF12EF|nr:NUDIX domain-containing protein [Actinomadura hibisca]
MDALLILIRDGHVLLAQRAGTGYADGRWNLPSGKLEAGETIAQAAIREAHEEIGVRIAEHDLRFAHLIHYRNHLGNARMGTFFEVRRWDGEPCNAEPHKCSQIAWWPLDRLPAATYPYTAEGLAAFQRQKPFSAVGWDNRSEAQPF